MILDKRWLRVISSTLCNRLRMLRSLNICGNVRLSHVGLNHFVRVELLLGPSCYFLMKVLNFTC